MEEIINNKQIILKNFITGAPKETDMELKEGETRVRVPRGSGGVLVKNLFLSCDPYMRGRMREYYQSYIPPFQPGSVIEGFGVAKVVDSDNVKFVVGDFVEGMTGWEEYSLILNTDKLRKIEINDVPLSYHVGLLGMPGFTAYAGFYEVCSPQKGDYVFVSAASGAVGQLVGQLAKLYGCYVVGSAGTKQKIDLLKNKLGFDEAFNYKEEPDLNAALNRICHVCIHGLYLYQYNIFLYLEWMVLVLHGSVGTVAQFGCVVCFVTLITPLPSAATKKKKKKARTKNSEKKEGKKKKKSAQDQLKFLGCVDTVLKSLPLH